MLTRGLAGGVLVLLGGLVISTLPDSTALLQAGLLDDLRSTTTGRMVGLAVVLLGLGLQAAAWLSLCRYAARAGAGTGDDRPAGVRVAESVSLVRFATLVWCAPLVLAPPLFSRDGWSYAAQGMLTHLGVSPYDHGPTVLQGPILEGVDPRWMDTPTPYGPLPLIFGDLVAGATGNPWLLVVAHRVLALVGLALLAWAVPRLAAWTGVNPALSTAVVCASPLMLANGAAGLHNDLLMVGLMAAALVVAVDRGWWAGAVLGGLAAAVKLPGGLVCIAVALLTLPVAATLVQRCTRLAATAVVAVATLVVPGFATGLGLGWVEALTVPGTVNTPLSLTTVVGGALDGLARLVGLGTPPATFLDLVRQVGTLASFGVAAWVALRRPTGDRAASVVSVAVMTGALLLLSPVVHLWYFLWVLPFLACLRLGRASATGLLVVCVVTGLVAPLDSSLHGAYTAIVIGSGLVGVLFGVLLLTRRSRERIDRIVTADWLPTPR